MYLGVDGGGTKTAFVLINNQGVVLAQHLQQSAYYLEVGLTALESQIVAGISKVLDKAKVSASEVDFAFLGLPAYGEDSSLISVFDNIPIALFPRKNYRCDNDMVCGWASAFGGNSGINIVAGTGSIAYGEHNGVSARCGGWGELFSDEGSAYWIAIEGLRAFSRMSDNRQTKTKLYTLLKEHLLLRSDLDICGVVLDEWQGSRSKVAALSQVVCQAAQCGDLIALDIFHRAASDLAEMVEGTRKSLHLTAETINVSYSGGVFNAGDLILSQLRSSLVCLHPGYRLQPPIFRPDVGSALYAAKINGFTFSEENLNKLRIKAY